MNFTGINFLIMLEGLNQLMVIQSFATNVKTQKNNLSVNLVSTTLPAKPKRYPIS